MIDSMTYIISVVVVMTVVNVLQKVVILLPLLPILGGASNGKWLLDLYYKTEKP